MRKCECGGTFMYDGYDEIGVDERGLLCITGECKCDNCCKEAIYTDYHIIDFDNPHSVEIDINVDGID